VTKSLSKILKFYWIFNWTFRILKIQRYTPFSCLKFNSLQMYNKCSLQIGKCIPGGTSSPGWESLLYSISVEGQKFLWQHKLKPFGVLSIIATVRSHWTGLFGLSRFGHNISVHKQLYIPLIKWLYRLANVTLAGVVLTPFENSWLRLNLNCNCDFEEFVFNCKMSIMIWFACWW